MLNDTDVMSITGCSAALMISDIPWNGPVAGVRVGRVDGEFIANPTFEQRESSDMDIIVVLKETLQLKKLSEVLLKGKKQPIDIFAVRV